MFPRGGAAATTDHPPRPRRAALRPGRHARRAGRQAGGAVAVAEPAHPDVDRHAGHRIAVERHLRPRGCVPRAGGRAEPGRRRRLPHAPPARHGRAVPRVVLRPGGGAGRRRSTRSACCRGRTRSASGGWTRSTRRGASPVATGPTTRSAGCARPWSRWPGCSAQTGRTMRQHEFAALTTLAGLSRAELDGMLLSVDRFARVESALDTDARARLIERFGLFGVRLGATLIRQGVTDPTALAAELVRRSGLDDLRSLLTTQFAERRDLLKARSALLAVELVLNREPRPAAAPLAAEMERDPRGCARVRRAAAAREHPGRRSEAEPRGADRGGTAARRRGRRTRGPARARPRRGPCRAAGRRAGRRRAGGSGGRRARCPAARCPTSRAWSSAAAKASWPS